MKPGRALDDPMAMLAEIAASRPERRLHPDVHAWLTSGLRRWLDACGALSLEQAFAIKPGRGKRSLPRAMMVARCAGALVLAIDAIDAPDLHEWRRCDLLLEELARFARDYWPAWRAAGGAPAGSSRLNEALYELTRVYAQFDKPLPTTTDAVYAALRRARATYAKSTDARSRSGVSAGAARTKQVNQLPLKGGEQ